MHMAPTLLLALLLALVGAVAAYDYSDALAKSLLYYEAQRSGRLPGGQRASWRGDSALDDGKAEGVDLVGGYYDAGDNVKFGLPMAFTITMLSWSAVEYGRQMQAAGQLEYALDSIRWGTDYLLKAHSEPLVLWGQVGDGANDHGCWQRPEDMTTYRKAYKIDASSPGSDLAGETAAAMAAASICFRSGDPSYSSILVEHAKQLFEFADKYRGKYDTSIPAARNFYSSKSGYADELLWASLWLYEATSEDYYLDYAARNAAALGGTSWSIAEFSWDVKYPGVQVLASKILMQGRGGRHENVLMQYQSRASFVLCAALQKNEGVHIQRTPGGLMFVRPWNNMQYVVTASYLLTIYSDYLASTSQALQCTGGSADPSELLQLAKSQVDYILGDNPRATSYLVGYGPNYPRRVHHRASSIVSIKVNSAFVSCRGGYSQWYLRNLEDPNLLVGALVGGPDQFDNFADERYNFEQTEPTSYNNGPLIGVLARLLEAPSYSGKPRHSASSKNSVPMHVLDSSATQTTGTTPTASSTGQVVQITQRIVGSWRLRGDTNYKYEVTVKNTSGKRLSKLVLRITGLHGPYWGLSRTTPAAAGATSQDEATFTFPAWLQSLRPLESLVFVYIHEAAAAQATVSLDSYTTS